MTFQKMQDVITSYSIHYTKLYEYRLEGIGYDYELDDFIYGKGVSIIEWYPFILEMLPKEFLEIHISLLEDGNRVVLLKGSGVYEEILQQISYNFV